MTFVLYKVIRRFPIDITVVILFVFSDLTLFIFFNLYSVI